MNLRFYENLCDSNRKVLRICQELKKKQIIHNYFTRNGYIKIVENEGSRPFKIAHPDILNEKFADVINSDSEYENLYPL